MIKCWGINVLICLFTDEEDDGDVENTDSMMKMKIAPELLQHHANMSSVDSSSSLSNVSTGAAGINPRSKSFSLPQPNVTVVTIIFFPLL